MSKVVSRLFARLGVGGLLFAVVAGCAADPDPGKYPAEPGRASAGSPALNPPSGAAAAAGGAGATTGQAAPASPSSAGVVAEHGALRVAEGRIVDASGQPIQLRGMSLFWSQWSNYYLANTVDQLTDDWHASVVRAVLGVENGGYLENPAENEAKVAVVVERAIARGMYVIIDWHDHHAENHQAQAIDFFTRMAMKYGNSPAVLFEIYNEPLKVGWPVVKGYAEPVIAAIRGTGAKNIVIVGTPNWSQDVDVAARDPITAYSDVAYTLHFYAATHKQWLRDKAQQALDAKLPLFVTEWGACASSGDGALNESETRTWLDFLASNQISWANWALNDKAEACSALTPSAGTSGPWNGSSLSASGTLVKALMR